jgi:hypothetical protein
MKKTIVIITGIFLLATMAYTQEIKLQTHTVSVNWLGIKDQMNYGLVFRGPGIGYAYSARWENKDRILAYEGRFSFSMPVTRSIVGGAFNVMPVRFDYLFKTGADGKVSLGPYAIMEYNYELYPDLQSGYSFWLTQYSLGFVMTGWFNVKKSRIDLSIHQSAFGITSHQPEIDDPYFFDQSFAYAVKFVHQDFQFGSLDRYNQTELEMRWTPKAGSRLAYAYSFQTCAYFKEPALNMINNTIKIIFLPKKD